MKKVLIVGVKPNSAIDRLAYMIRDNNEHLDIKVLPVHPKKPDNLKEFEELVKWADVIHYAYWKSAEMLRERYPAINKPAILSHHNPYDLTKSDWKKYDIVTGCNKELVNVLKDHTNRDVAYIPLAVNLDEYKFANEYTKEKSVLMVSQRIESKKGVREVAKACYDLGYKFILSGAVSKVDYFHQIFDVNPNTQWEEWASEERLIELYQTSAVHICNSVDNFESGTMPVLEAMATGCAVFTRNVGHIPDLNNGENMYVYDGEGTDAERLKANLKSFMEDEKSRIEMRKKAWQTVKGYNHKAIARRYAKLYNKVYFNEPLVSVIIPTFNTKDWLKETLESLEEQTYPNIEAVVCDDNSTDGTEVMVKELELNYPIKYINTKTEGYNLAMARNMGIIETEGDIIVFCDVRLKPNSDAIYKFAKVLLPNRDKVWCYGNKGSGKRDFVENFSAIRRNKIISSGMFNERINMYGGMTQEIRERFGSQGYDFKYVQFAVAKEIKSSKAKNKRNEIWKAKNIISKLYDN